MTFPGQQAPPLGATYQRRNVVLSRGNDWIVAFTPLDGNGQPLAEFGWPEGTRVLLQFGPHAAPSHTVEGQVSSAQVSFRIESDTADTIPAGIEVRAQIQFPGDPTTELPWWRGKVRRDD